jgi:H+-transporting ATPase
MRNYCLYRISCTIQLLCFFFFAIVAVDPNNTYFYGQVYDGLNDPSTGHPFPCQINHNSAFTLPVLSLVVITILNDGTIITIAYDKVIPENRPQKWDMVEVCASASASVCVVVLRRRWTSAVASQCALSLARCRW